MLGVPCGTRARAVRSVCVVVYHVVVYFVYVASKVKSYQCIFTTQHKQFCGAIKGMVCDASATHKTKNGYDKPFSVYRQFYIFAQPSNFDSKSCSLNAFAMSA